MRLLLRLLTFIILFSFMTFYIDNVGSFKDRESERVTVAVSRHVTDTVHSSINPSTDEYCKLDICNKECSVSVDVKPQSTFIKVGNTVLTGKNGSYILHIVALKIGTCQVSSSYTCIDQRDFDSRLVDYLRALPLSTPIVGVIKPNCVPWQDFSEDLEKEVIWNLGMNKRYNPYIGPVQMNATKTLAFTIYYRLLQSPAFKASSFQTMFWETSFREGLLISPNFTDVPLPPVLESSINVFRNVANEDNSNFLHWSPPSCIPKWTIAVIIPIRKREEQLRILINNLFPFLQRQLIAFSIYVIDQSSDLMFNKARVMNIGFLEARRRHNYDCYVFHDVDMVPENLCNLYECGPHARHLTLADKKNGYQLQYYAIFGGAIILNETHIRAANGFSNIMWGRGGVSDNMRLRVEFSKFKIVRYPPQLGRYDVIQHFGESAFKSAKFRRGEELQENALYREFDGISTLNMTTDYRILGVERSSMFTRIRVSLPRPEGGNIKRLWLKKMADIKEMYKEKKMEKYHRA